MELDITCPKCGSTHPPDSNFCNKCGHDLSLSAEPTPNALSFDEKIDKINVIFPKASLRKSWPKETGSRVNANKSR